MCWRSAQLFTKRDSCWGRHLSCGRLNSGFTLIELLVVIAVIALLASMIFPITGAVARNKIRSRSRVEMARCQAAIESYKAKLGHYPPDNQLNPPFDKPTLNQLYYELVGTALSNNGSYTSLDGSSSLLASHVKMVFGTDGFVNSTKGASSDEAPPATPFLTGLRPDQAVLVPEAVGRSSSVKILVGYPWKKTTNPPFNVDPLPAAPGVNPWRYRSHPDALHPLNNPDSYDLWLDVNIGGTVYRICNWSSQPLKVTSSLDN